MQWPEERVTRYPCIRFQPFTLLKRLFGRRNATLFHLDRLWSDHLAWIQDTRDSIHLVSLGGREPIDEFLKWAMVEFTKMQNEIDEAVVSEMTTIVRKDGPVNLDMERLKGPSSTWTYLLDENQFGWGIEMVKAKNAGFLYTAWNAPHFLGSLFILTLLLSRRRKRNHEVKTALEQRGES